MDTGRIVLLVFVGLFLAVILAVILLSDRFIKNEDKNTKK
jgi:hypothetical protein